MPLTSDGFLAAAWRPRWSTCKGGSFSTAGNVRSLVTMESVPLGAGEREVSR